MDGLIPQSISGSAFIAVPVIGTVVFLVTKVLRNALVKAQASAIVNTAGLRSWYVAEAAGWMAYIYWALSQFLGKGPYFITAIYIVVGVVMFWIAWFVVRDLVAGYSLRMQNTYTKGQHIKVDDVEGTIHRIRQMGLEVELNDGIVATIPYNRIAGRTHYVKASMRQKRLSQFQITVPATGDLRSVTLKLRHLIVSSPWIDPTEEPQIELIEQLKDQFRFSVSVHTYNGNYDALLEEYLQENAAT